MADFPAFFIDECVRREVVAYLKAKGLDITSMGDIAPSAPDLEVIRQSAMRQRVLMTADYDFGELVFRDGHAALGVVLLALGRLRTAGHGPIVYAALETHRSDLIGKFLTIEPARTRIRGLGS